MKNITNILKRLKLKHKLHDKHVDLIKNFSYEFLEKFLVYPDEQNVLEAKKEFDKLTK